MRLSKRTIFRLTRFATGLLSMAVLFMLFANLAPVYTYWLGGLSIVMIFVHDRMLKNCLLEERQEKEQAMRSSTYSVSIKRRIWGESIYGVLFGLGFLSFGWKYFSFLVAYLVILSCCRLVSGLRQLADGVCFIVVEEKGILYYKDDIGIHEFEEMSAMKLKDSTITIGSMPLLNTKMQLLASHQELIALRKELEVKARAVFARFEK